MHSIATVDRRYSDLVEKPRWLETRIEEGEVEAEASYDITRHSRPLVSVSRKLQLVPATELMSERANDAARPGASAGVDKNLVFRQRIFSLLGNRPLAGKLDNRPTYVLDRGYQLVLLLMLLT